MTAKYSKAVQSAADRFLAEYSLTLEQLTEVQQKQVVIYLQTKKWWPWMSLVLLAATVIFGYCVWIKYGQAQEFLNTAVNMPESSGKMDLLKFSSVFLEQGFLIGFCLLSMFYMILFIVLIPMNLRSQKQTLAAFLSSIPPRPKDESGKQD